VSSAASAARPAGVSAMRLVLADGEAAGAFVQQRADAEFEQQCQQQDRDDATGNADRRRDELPQLRVTLAVSI
jgi:hypothetical protein